LTPSQINEHTTIEYMEESSSDNFECSICQETVSTGVYRKLNICSHRFHIQCIDNWLDNHSTCPVCRQELLPGNSSSRLFRNILNQLRTTISSRTTTP
jgi:E3 ubiquitin-protein ligase ATL6/9/15/31/42/55